MFITEKPIKISLTDSLDPLSDMIKLKQERKNPNAQKTGITPIYFYRYIGVNTTEAKYIEKLSQTERSLEQANAKYLIISDGLSQNFSEQELTTANEIWQQFKHWETSGNSLDLYNINWHTMIENNRLQWTLKQNFMNIIRLFESIENRGNETIRKNFGISLILWLNTYIKKLFPVKWADCIPKLVFYGPIRRNEVYFLMLLATLGCDVLYVNPVEDKEFRRIDPHCTYSRTLEFPKLSSLLAFPQKQKIPANCSNDSLIVNQPLNISTSGEASATEKNYEELALLSASVVMIKVYDRNLSPCGGGSGVVIDTNGLIVTNYHVVEDGHIFGIVFENCDKEFIVHKIISKNSTADLALLRIDHKTQPITIENTNNLKRGQQIVAIGSPLGLMNTISNGIIAGFRTFRYQDFIQITAPISPGSSGGALLDKYGYLVGITTAGYDEGQNLNLAVPSREILKLISRS